MNIGNKILQLRKSLNLTQAQLADAVGVSVPAVSKWETGSTLPDITLLAPIARKLGTDINDLISYKESLSDWEVDLLVKEINISFKSNGYMAGVNKSLSFLKEYPNNNYLKLNVANRIMMYRNLAFNECTEDELQELSEKSEAILYDVYTHANPNDNPVIHTAAISTLISRYIENDKLVAAEELLLHLPEQTSSGRELLKTVYVMQKKYLEAKEVTQREFLTDLSRLTFDIHVLFNVAIQQKNYENAIGYAKDYYTICKTLKSQSSFPSELLVEVYITQEDFTPATKHFSSYIDEIIESETIFENSKYFDAIKDTIQTWNSTILNDYKTDMYNAIHSRPLLNELLKLDDVKVSMKRLKDSLQKL